MKFKGIVVFVCYIVKDILNIKWFKGYDEIFWELNDKIEIVKDGNYLFFKIKNVILEDIDEYVVEIEGKRYFVKLIFGGIKILFFILKDKFCVCIR